MKYSVALPGLILVGFMARAENLYQPPEPNSDVKRFEVAPPAALPPAETTRPPHDPVERRADGSKVYRTAPGPRVYVHPDNQCCGTHGFTPIIGVDPRRHGPGHHRPEPQPVVPLVR